MATWIALLRAVNLGGTRKFSPREIVTCLEDAGFAGVQTHINTGNVRFTTRMRSPERIVAAMERAFVRNRGFEVPVVLWTPEEVRACADDLDEVGAGHAGAHTVSFLAARPAAETVASLEALSAGEERVVVRDRAVHLLSRAEVQRSRLNNTRVERLAGVATNRNRRVVSAIADRWCRP